MDKTNRSDATLCVAKDCDSTVDNHRLHLGYTTCLECSEEEKYSAHQVYPHKTGGYVQPIKKSESENLKRLDRRSTGSGKTAAFLLPVFSQGGLALLVCLT